MKGQIKRRAAELTKHQMTPATVVDVVKDRCAVRLSSNGAVLRGLSYIGGPLVVGQKVFVNFTSRPPIVQAMGLPKEVEVKRTQIKRRTVRSDLQGGQLGGVVGYATTGIIHYSGNFIKATYDPSHDGLVEALAAAIAGDTLVLPPADYVGDINIPDGVALMGAMREKSRIIGQTTCAGEAILQDLHLENEAPVGQTAKVLVAGGDNKTVTLIEVSIIANVPQSGVCYGVSVEGLQAQVQARDCYLSGTWNQSTLVYFTGLTGQSMGARYVYFDGNNPTNDASRLFTYACQFDPQAASYGTPEVGDRAAYEHTHTPDEVGLGDFGVFPEHTILHIGDRFLVESYLNSYETRHLLYEDLRFNLMEYFNTLYMQFGYSQVIFTVENDVEVVAGKLHIYNNSGSSRNIVKVHLAVDTAPAGAALIVDIHKNGTTIFTNQNNRPQIAAGSNTGQSTSIDIAAWNDGEYLTMDVDQVGSTTAGKDLVVTVVYQ